MLDNGTRVVVQRQKDEWCPGKVISSEDCPTHGTLLLVELDQPDKTGVRRVFSYQDPQHCQRLH